MCWADAKISQLSVGPGAANELQFDGQPDCVDDAPPPLTVPMSYPVQLVMVDPLASATEDLLTAAELDDALSPPAAVAGGPPDPAPTQ